MVSLSTQSYLIHGTSGAISIIAPIDNIVDSI